MFEIVQWLTCRTMVKDVSDGFSISAFEREQRERRKNVGTGIFFRGRVEGEAKWRKMVKQSGEIREILLFWQIIGLAPK